MIQVYPIREERIESLRGHMVCVITQRGEQHIGRVSGCRNGKLVLEIEDDSVESECEEQEQEHHEHKQEEQEHHEKKKHSSPEKHKNRKKPLKKRRKHQKKCGCSTANTSAFLPNRIRRRRAIEFDLAAIAFLFLLLI